MQMGGFFSRARWRRQARRFARATAARRATRPVSAGHRMRPCARFPHWSLFSPPWRLALTPVAAARHREMRPPTEMGGLLARPAPGWVARAGGRGGNVSGGAGGGTAGSAGAAGAGNDGGTAGEGGTVGAGNAAGSGGCGGTTGGAPEACACPPGRLSCGGACVPSDGSHCGDCTTTCGNGQVCVNEVCACPSGLRSCGGACVPSDSSHCGDCTTTCAASDLCVADQCVPRCPAAQTACPSGACVDTNSDVRNCGGCGRVCPGGTSCKDGTCS